MQEQSPGPTDPAPSPTPSTADFRIEEGLEQDFEVVTVVGDIDIETARELRAHLVDRYAAGESRVIVDLSRVGFMDSSGLGALVGGWQLLRERGAFRLAAANQIVQRMLVVAGMADVFDTYDSVEAAATA